MRYTSIILAVLVLLGTAAAQSTSVTGTITDGDGNAWANGSYQVSFVPAPQSTTATWNGSTLSAGVYTSGSLNGSGAISVSLPKNSVISPSGNNWLFTICPDASGACFTYLANFSTSSVDLTSPLSAAAISPRFSAGPYAHGYADAEVFPTPPPGGTYYNVTSGCLKVWSGSAWSCVGSGSAPGTPIACSAVTGGIIPWGTCSITLTASQVNAATSPVTLIAAQGANTFIDPIDIVVEYKKGSAAFSDAGSAFNVGYGDLSNSSWASWLATQFINQSASQIIGVANFSIGGSGVAGGMPSSAVSVDVANLPFVLGNNGVASTSGTGSTVTFFIHFVVETLN